MTKHLVPEQIARYRAGALPSVEELLAVEEHLDACDTCRDALRAGASAATGSLVRKLVAAAEDFACPDERLLQRYVENRVDAAEREIVETHVEDCARCARNLEALRWRAARSPCPSSTAPRFRQGGERRRPFRRRGKRRPFRRETKRRRPLRPPAARCFRRRWGYWRP